MFLTVSLTLDRMEKLIFSLLPASMRAWLDMFRAPDVTFHDLWVLAVRQAGHLPEGPRRRGKEEEGCCSTRWRRWRTSCCRRGRRLWGRLVLAPIVSAKLRHAQRVKKPEDPSEPRCVAVWLSLCKNKYLSFPHLQSVLQKSWTDFQPPFDLCFFWASTWNTGNPLVFNNVWKPVVCTFSVVPRLCEAVRYAVVCEQSLKLL